MKSVYGLTFLGAVAFCGLAVAPAQADTFTFTSCHISGGCPSTDFGTVTLTQSGTSVNFDVVLINGNRFVETGAGGGQLFLFNDSIASSTITNITATLNGADVTSTILGGLTGVTGATPAIMANGTGTFTAGVSCTTFSSCNGGSAPPMNDLHFTVTNATLAQLEVANANGNLFVADILCGSTQTGCTAGLTGPVDVPGPIVGAGLPGLVMACGGLIALARRRRRQIA